VRPLQTARVYLERVRLDMIGLGDGIRYGIELIDDFGWSRAILFSQTGPAARPCCAGAEPAG